MTKDYWNFTGLNRRKPITIEDKIEDLIKDKYTQAAFTYKKNADKFVKVWKRNAIVKKVRIERTNGPTIEDPKRRIRKAYYVMVDIK